MPSFSASSPTHSSPSHARACSIRRRVVLASILKVDSRAFAWRTEIKGRAASGDLGGQSMKVFLRIRNLGSYYTISCNKQVLEFRRVESSAAFACCKSLDQNDGNER